MNSEEDFLQEQVESGKGDNNIDAVAYRKIFSALSHDPGPQLPLSFPDRLVMMVQQQHSAKASRLEIVLASVGGFLSILIFGVAVVLTGFKLELGFLEPVGDFKGILMFGIAFIFLLQWLDKKIVRKHLST